MERNLVMNKNILIFLVFSFSIFFLAGCKDKTIQEKRTQMKETGKYESYGSLSRDIVSISNSELPKLNIDTYNIRLGFSTNMNDPRAEASLIFKSLVEEGTFGRITVELFPAGMLGSDSEMIEMVIQNQIDMVISSAGNYASYVTIAGYSAMPFLFKDFDEAWKFLDGNENQKINVAFEPYNMKVLGYFDNGFRCVTTSANKGPVNSVKDMKDLVIRTSANQIVMETMYQLDAVPKSFPFGLLKEALRNKEFDAQENPIPIIYNNKLYEEQKYLAITNHSYDAMPLTMRKELWDSFSIADQKVIMNAAKRAQELNRKIVSSQTKNFISELKNVGMIITYPDLTEFKKSTEGVFEVFAPLYGKDLLEELKNF